MRYHLVSACLLGIKSRYDGSSALRTSLLKRLKDKPILLICPEKLGGLPTPRPPAQIVSRSPLQVKTRNKDVTAAFLRGADRLMKLLKSVSISDAYLKSRSPSCGYRKVYQRGPDNIARLVKGNGILAELLMAKSIKIKSIS
ncbi:MAG: DUF523 domain-containing protein [Planctomycetes bacterium]|nr:DUF523 domain-containing protein [Planctomycetota bacterium]